MPSYSPRRKTRLAPVAGVVVALATIAAFTACSKAHSFGELDMRGAPVVVNTMVDPTVIVVASSWESYQPQNTMRRGSLNAYSKLHLDVFGFDARTMKRKWAARMASIEHGVLDTDTGILGVSGNTAWMLADGIMGVSVNDGRFVGDAAAIESKNPSLKGLMPMGRKQIYFDNGLVIISADGNRWRIDGQTLAATPDTTTTPIKQSLVGVPLGRATDTLNFVPITLHEQYQAFKTRSVLSDGKWYGLMHHNEIAQQRRGQSAQNFSAPMRYRLFSSPLKDTVDRMRDPVRIPWDYTPLEASPEFLNGGLLTAYARDGREAVLAIPDPVRLLVLHQNRVDSTAVQTITCIALDGKVCWEAPLGISIASGIAPLRGAPDQTGIVVVGEGPAQTTGSGSNATQSRPTSFTYVAIASGKTARVSLADIDLAELQKNNAPFHRR